MTAIAGRRTERRVIHDPPSFEDVYTAHYADLTVQLYAYFGNRQDAHDVVQEAFYRALIRWNTVARDFAVGTVKSWLSIIPDPDARHRAALATSIERS